MNVRETGQARKVGRVVLAGRNWSRRGDESRGCERERDQAGGGPPSRLTYPHITINLRPVGDLEIIPIREAFGQIWDCGSLVWSSSAIHLVNNSFDNARRPAIRLGEMAV